MKKKYNLRPRKKKTKVHFNNVCIHQYNTTEFNYYSNLPISDRYKIATKEKQLIDKSNTKIPIRFKILDSDINDQVKLIAIDKVNSLSGMTSNSDEYSKTLSWIQSVGKVPFGKYKQLAVNATSTKDDIRNFIKSIRTKMDLSIYGHSDAKAQIIRVLAQWISNPNSKGLAIGIHGPIGVGKTSYANAICSVLGLPFGFVPLGGASDSCYLDGHSSTYSGAKWGKLVDIAMQTGCMNPVLFFDELDKVSTSEKGDEIINLLIHLTDAAQNDKFVDKFFSEFEFDFSRCLIIFSYNDESKISPILRDRIVRIEAKGYSLNDKYVIGKDHMVPVMLKEHGMKNGDVVFTNGILKSIIDSTEEEKGVRNMKRALGDVVSNLNLRRLMDDTPLILPYTVTDADVHLFVNNKRNNDIGHLSNSMYR